MLRSLIVPVLAVLVLAVPAYAATRGGLTPTEPEQGAQLEAGAGATFSGRARGDGSVWVRVCRSRSRNAAGLICRAGLEVRARRDGSRWSVRPKLYEFPGYWANRPGRWYWQAHRVSCDVSGRNCAKPGPIQSLRVR